MLIIIPVRGEESSPPKSGNPSQTVNWDRHLADFQSAVAEKQVAAAQVFLESGSSGYNELGALLKHADADVVKRAAALREQINRRSMQLFSEMAGRRQKVDSEPLTASALQELHKGWLRVAAYAPQSSFKQNCFQQAVEAQQLAQTVEATNKELALLDEELKKLTNEQTVGRAATQLSRANALKMLQRDADAIGAAQATLDIGGKECRHAPAALKLLVELHLRRQDLKNAEVFSRRILQDHPRSLEVKFAHQSLMDLLVCGDRWDEAFQQVKSFIGAFPLDSDAQDQAYSLLESLMNADDYNRVAALTDWLMNILPMDRLTLDVPKYAGGCSEYVLKDQAKAARIYKLILDKFADVVSAADMNAALSRVQVKAEGKFPKEPVETDEGPAGALARLLKAVRDRDSKTLALVLSKDQAEQAEQLLAAENFISSITFADYIVKATKVAEDANHATLTLDHYTPSAALPESMEQTAVKEDGQWKIEWKNQKGDENDNAVQP
ncbi:MAG: hypothetical protein V1899_06910 [Planctomycetota bacterium]